MTALAQGFTYTAWPAIIIVGGAGVFIASLLMLARILTRAANRRPLTDWDLYCEAADMRLLEQERRQQRPPLIAALDETGAAADRVWPKRG